MNTLPAHLQAAYGKDPRRQQLAQLLAKGSSTAPVSSHLEGLARVLQSGLGQYQQNKLDENYEGQAEQYQGNLADALSAETPEARMAAIQGMGAGGIGLQEALLKRQMEQQGAANKPPPSRTVQIGDRKVTQEWDGQQWRDYAKAPAYKPDLLSPEAMAQRIAIRKAGKPSVSVGGTTVRMPGETVAEAEAKAFGKSLVSGYEGIQERAGAAEDVLGNLYTMKSIDVNSGALEPFKAWTAGMAEGLGVDPGTLGLDSATNAQSFVGIAQNLVLTKMQAQKGPQTENDAKRIEQTVASLRNTPEAKDFLTDAAISIEERKVEQRDFYESFQAEKGTLRGAAKAWNDFKRKTPLLGKNPNTGRPVFFNQFRRLVLEANPGADQEQVLELWRSKYGG